MTQLSERLLIVAAQVPPGTTVADIGSDHGMLPVHLVTTGSSPRCVAIELTQGPFDMCRHAVADAKLSNVIDVRLGNGLEPLSGGEVDVVCIAGMGGATIAGILERGRARLSTVQRLVLQPNGGGGALRRHLYQTGWQIVDEHALEERGRFYVVIVAEPGDPSLPYAGLSLDLETSMEAGPILLQNPCGPHRRRWEEERDHLTSIINQLSSHPSPRNITKRATVTQQRDAATDILAVLNQVLT